MFNLIPLPVRIGTFILLLVGAFGFGYLKGSSSAKVQIQKFATVTTQKVVDLQTKNADISGKVITQYVDRVNTVKEKEYVYLDKINNSVPNQHDMSNGWVYIHDISATNGDADTTRSSDASPSGVKDTEALATIIANYANCKANSEQLIALQKWVADNKTAVDAENTKSK